MEQTILVIIFSKFRPNQKNNFFMPNFYDYLSANHYYPDVVICLVRKTTHTRGCTKSTQISVLWRKKDIFSPLIQIYTRENCPRVHEYN